MFQRNLWEGSCPAKGKESPLNIKHLVGKQKAAPALVRPGKKGLKPLLGKKVTTGAKSNRQKGGGGGKSLKRGVFEAVRIQSKGENERKRSKKKKCITKEKKKKSSLRGDANRGS